MIKKFCNTHYLMHGLTGFAFWLLCLTTVYALPGNRLISVSYVSNTNEEYVEIKTTKRQKFYITKLDRPKRLVCTIKHSYFLPVHQAYKTNSKHIKSLRVSQNTKAQTRVVLDMKKQSSYSIDTSLGKDGTHLLRIRFSQTPEGLQPIALPIISPFLIAQVSSPNLSDTEIQHGSGHLQNTDQTLTNFPPSPVEKSKTEIKKESSPYGQSALNKSLVTNFDESIFDDVDSASSTEKDLQFSGSVQIRGAADLNGDGDNEHEVAFKNRTILKLQYKNNFVLSGLSDYLYFGSENDTDDYDLDLFETYYRHFSGGLTFTIGKQIKRWGKSDQISFIDTLNPQNITEFIVPDYEERRIPVWMVDIAYRKKDFFIEGFFIPFFEPNHFDYFGTDWAVFRHLKNNITDSPLLNPAQKAYFTGIGVNESDPDNGTDSFEYALRTGGTFDQFDFGFTYHYTNEDIPHFKSFPVKNLSVSTPGSVTPILSNLGALTLTNEAIEVEYLRSHVFGFEFETILSKFGIRGEAAFKDNESFLTRSFTSVRKPTLSWIIGADYTSADELYLNLQFAHQHISDYEDSILIQDRNNYLFLGEISRPVFSDWLEAALEGSVFLSDSSYYLSPRLIYTYIKNLELILGLNLFEGSEDTIYGQYDENDQIFINIKYFF